MSSSIDGFILSSFTTPRPVTHTTRCVIYIIASLILALIALVAAIICAIYCPLALPFIAPFLTLLPSLSVISVHKLLQEKKKITDYQYKLQAHYAKFRAMDTLRSERKV